MNLDRVQVIAGTVPGTRHTQPGKPVWKNNQDALCLLESPEYVIGVIADGCSRGDHSEVGAHLGARILADIIAREVIARAKVVPTGLKTDVRDLDWGYVKFEFVRRLMLIVHDLPNEPSATIAESFLFAVIGFVVTPTWTVIFRLGDGMDVVNGEVRITPRYGVEGRPDLENAPPYIMYAITGSPVTDHNPKLLDFVVDFIETDRLQTLLIASDGGEDLMGATETETSFPGTTDPVGSIMQVFTDEFFENPDNMRRFLARANRETVSNGHIRGGLLPDDTTIIAVRVTAPREDGKTT